MKNYNESEISVCLASDHGQSYLAKDNDLIGFENERVEDMLLSAERTKAIWLFKSGTIQGREVLEYTGCRYI